MNNPVHNIQDSINLIKFELKQIYSLREIDSFIQLIFDHLLNLSGIKLHQNLQTILSEDDYLMIIEYVSALKTKMPIQYILGKTEFYNLIINVNSSVLIPRPETEELVDWIIKEHKNQELNIIDIGTGSGCIAIALKNNLPKAKVFALDISETALQLARKNAKLNNVDIQFVRTDILKEKHSFNDERFDIIVSNPPYVMESEKEQMNKNVLGYEPHISLFVSDNDALLFYREICNFAKNRLNKGGSIYFEINEQLGNQTIDLLKQYGFNNVILKKDLEGKDRMVKGTFTS